jgi:hypothetical protein
MAQYIALRTGGVMARPTTSVRLDEELRDRLSAAAAAENTTVTELIERFVREGLAVAGHPGIVFKPGPTGRRAALAGGPDVWEVVAALRHVVGPEAKRVRELAKQFGIHERQVAIALNYAAANRDEIDARIRANDAAMTEAERVAGERTRLLA